MATRDLDGAFWPALQKWAAAWGVPATWPLLAFYAESRLTPRICNAAGYCGLNQMSARYLQGRGIDPATYATWPASEQLNQVIGPWYTAQLGGTRPSSPGVFYAFNLAPGRAKGATADTVLYAAPSREYDGNKGLDVNGDGKITVGDLDAKLFALSSDQDFKYAASYVGGVQTIPRPAEGLTAPRIGTILAVTAGVGLLGFAAYEISRDHHHRRARENPLPKLTDKQLLLVGGGLVGASLVAALAMAAKGKSAAGALPHAPAVSSSGVIRAFPVDRSRGGVHYWDDFGQPRNGHTHQGNDIFGPEGALIYAPHDGTVKFATDPLGGPSFSLAGDGVRSYGAHLSAYLDDRGLDVATATPPPARAVKAGDGIGRVGHSGNAAGTPPHLHFQLWVGGALVDPYSYLRSAETVG